MDCLLIFITEAMLIILSVYGKLQKLTSVCKFKGLEELHSHLYDKQLNMIPKIKKTDVCRTIFGSNYFKQKELRMITGTTSFAGLPPCFWCGGNDYTIEDSSTENISVYNGTTKNTIVENVSVCLARKSRTTNQSVEYFISKEYNVNDLPGRHIAGHFVFKEENGKFLYEALAEEPAVLVDGNVEKLYLDLRGSHQPVDDKIKDPLCKLDIQKQLRICSIAMNTPHLAEFKFIPTTDYVYRTCPSRKLSFRTPYGISRTAEKTYEELAIMCLVKRDYNFVSFYLSRAYESQKVFIYQYGETGELYLESLITDVRGVSDYV